LTIQLLYEKKTFLIAGLILNNLKALTKSHSRKLHQAKAPVQTSSVILAPSSSSKDLSLAKNAVSLEYDDVPWPPSTYTGSWSYD